MKLFRTISVALCLIIILISFNTNVKALSLSAKSYCLINADTLEVISSNDAHIIRSMASTTKIMTALILAEQNTPEKTIVTTKDMVTVEGSSMGLLPGDIVSYKDLLAGLLLASGNDAANTVAIALAGSIENFAKMMNNRAAEIGMVNTNFVTPSGLDDPNHYSTAYDMALLASVAMKNNVFKEIVCCEKMKVSFGNPPYDRMLYNHNKLLSKYEYCIGVKTGFTKKSGRCLVSAAQKDGAMLIAVTLNAPNDWNDHINLLDYGFSKVKSIDKTCDLSNVMLKVVGGQENYLKLKTDTFICTCTDESQKGIICDINLLPFCYSPVSPNQRVGTVDYYYNGRLLHTSNIYTTEGMNVYVKKDTFLTCFKNNLVQIIKLFI